MHECWAQVRHQSSFSPSIALSSASSPLAIEQQQQQQQQYQHQGDSSGGGGGGRPTSSAVVGVDMIAFLREVRKIVLMHTHHYLSTILL
jgi:hypothetical protein